MARRKLSKAQRDTLRRILEQELGFGKPVPQVLKSVAKRFAISTETVRWYLTQRGKNRSPFSDRRPSSTNPLVLLTPRNFQAALRRTLKVEHLIPKLEAERRRGVKLEREANRVARLLRSVELRSRLLERQIMRLVSS